MHLHWLWRHPDRVGNVTRAISACNEHGLTKGTWTVIVDDCTCRKCLDLTKRKQEEVKAPPPAATSKRRYLNKRPESPKGQVYSRFANDGREAAMAHGKSLGLPESKLIRWFDTEF